MNKYEFSHIEKICPEDFNTWNGKIFLTFDMDWAHDDVIMDCYELISRHSIKTTWFVTHDSNLLNILRKDKKIELGAHPNFNKLLSGLGEGVCNTSSFITQEIKELVPEATSIRSHSLTQSERLIDQFLDNGFKRICNLFIPYRNKMHIYPYYLWGGAMIIPHRFQDNASLRVGDTIPDLHFFNKGLHVFDFHPIHVFLNTESLDRYERTRSLHYNPSALIKHRYDGYGTRNRLIDLIKIAKSL